jgi:hypothetical protein
MQENPQIIYSWKAPLRPYKKQGGVILRFYLALALLLSLIIFFFGDKILIVPIWSLLFLFYTFTITPPPEVENKITRFGIETTGITLKWENLSYFYFSKRFNFIVLTLVGQPPYYFHVYLVLKDEEMKNKLLHILSEYLIYQEKPQKNFTDKIVDWFSNLLPEEDRQDVLPKAQPVSP